MKRIEPLSDAECETLRAAWKDGPNGRVRQRAQAVYLAHRGYGRIALPSLFEVDVDTISAWLDGWERDGLCGLYDEPRSGRPRIYTPVEEARLCGWLEEEPRQVKRAQARLEQATGKQASRQTGTADHQKKDYRWKRCRRRVKGLRDEGTFRAAHTRLTTLRQGHARGVIEMFYFDQSGFGLTPAIPYAWQPRGRTRSIPSAASPRVNVLGFMSPTHQSPFHTVTGRVTSATVIAALDAFAAQTARAKKLRLVVLDHAPIHTSRAFQARILDWFRQGVGLHWRPPYSPELNLIEILWRKIKYQWLSPKAYLGFDHLKSELQTILDQFGSKYLITFG